MKCYRSFGRLRLNAFFIFTVVSQKWLIKTTTKPFSKLTNNRPSNKSKSNGHTRASGLEASLSSDWPVCKLAFKVKRIDQPKQRQKTTTHFCGKKWHFLSGGSKLIVSLTPLFRRQILWQLQQRWRLQNHPAFQAQRAGCELHTCPGASGISPETAENQSDMITDLKKQKKQNIFLSLFCVCACVGVCNILHCFITGYIELLCNHRLCSLCSNLRYNLNVTSYLTTVSHLLSQLNPMKSVSTYLTNACRLECSVVWPDTESVQCSILCIFSVYFAHWLKKWKAQVYQTNTQAHRDVEIAKGGDDAAAETHDQSTIRGDHELSWCSHGDTSCECGVLDVHLPGKAAC